MHPVSQVAEIQTEYEKLNRAMGIYDQIQKLKSVTGGSVGYGPMEDIAQELRTIARKVARVELSGFEPMERLKVLALRGEILTALKSAKRHLTAA